MANRRKKKKKASSRATAGKPTSDQPVHPSTDEPASRQTIPSLRVLRTVFLLGVASMLALLAAGFYESLRTEGRLPGISTTYMPYIEALFDAGEHEQAMEQLRLARALDIVNEPLLLNNLANALQAQGSSSEAMTHYREAIRVKPDYAMPYYNLAKALAEQGDAEGAIEHYRVAVELDPDYADAHNNLANALAAQGAIEEAVEHYERAIRVRPDDAATHNNLANVLAGQGRLEKATEHFQHALSLQPDNAATHNNLAWVLKGAGRLDEALRHFQEAVRLQPDFTSSLIGLSWLLATHPEQARRDPERALELAGRALSLSRRPDPTSLDIAAAAHAAAGDYDRAVELARAAVDLAPAHFAESQAIRDRLALYRQRRPYLEPRQAGTVQVSN